MVDISIKNFQSIKKVDFTVDGFTVIVGKNNIGKSAIVRAIDAALTNQSGNNFIRLGEKSTEVKINIKDSINFLWKKGDSASYEVGEGKEKETFTKLNRAIPEPLIKVGIEKMDIGDKKISPLIATQFEPLFLVNEGGAEVTEVLASLYNINTLSKADDLCQKELKSCKSELKTREQDLKELQEDLVKYSDFESIKQEVAEITKREEYCIRLQNEINSLVQYETNLKNLTTLVDSLKKVKQITIPDATKCEKIFPEIQWLIDKENQIQSTGKILGTLKGVYGICIPEIGSIETQLKELKQLTEFEQALSGVDNEIKKQEKILGCLNLGNTETDKIDSLLKAFNTLKTLEDDFMKTALSAKSTREELKTITTQLEEKEKLLAEKKVCPLCGVPRS